MPSISNRQASLSSARCVSPQAAPRTTCYCPRPDICTSVLDGVLAGLPCSHHPPCLGERGGGTPQHTPPPRGACRRHHALTSMLYSSRRIGAPMRACACRASRGRAAKRTGWQGGGGLAVSACTICAQCVGSGSQAPAPDDSCAHRPATAALSSQYVRKNRTLRWVGGRMSGKQHRAAALQATWRAPCDTCPLRRAVPDPPAAAAMPTPPARPRCCRAAGAALSPPPCTCCCCCPK